MAESLSVARAVKPRSVTRADPRDVLEQLDRRAVRPSGIDAIYGETLPQLLPRRLRDLIKAHWRGR